ncbi:MAG TPA: alkyl sulfatase dimerization domain-containing protein, partial [Kofleriaceae bacterium]|nr:alkyl sulfatase dimerization domain-containing protein [Kofleriaceae bacterium]
MTSPLVSWADALWTGARTMDHTSILGVGLGAGIGLEEVADRVAFLPNFANVIAIDGGDRLALVDTGSFLTAPRVFAEVRRWRATPLAAAVYTHGHVDHAMGLGPFDDEARGAGRPAPRVIAHEAVAARFDRYRMTAGWNTAINRRQFRVPGLRWPTSYRYPDETYRDRLDVTVGDVAVELHHGRGETDDHTWAWLPAQRVLCTGDLFIWAVPNCGNPQKVQRYVLEWAEALDAMRALGAEALLPGHGPPILGAARVEEALTDTAALLRSLHEQVLAAMNQALTLDEVVAAVVVPEALVARPYLRPVYDDPAFIVRNLWRRYGGWWDGDPAHLLPPREAALGAEVAALAGGAAALAARAEAVAADDLALACQLASWAAA